MVDCENAIETHNLTMRYGRHEAVRSLNLRVPGHHITGFLGRNGAGKSTTLRILLGITRPLEGTAIVLGRQATDPAQSREIRRRVAYVGEDKELLDYLTVDEQIRFTACFYPDMQPALIAKLKRQYELPSKRRVKELSRGMRTKLALLLVLARRPELLILDEPSDGLDPVSIEELLSAIVAVGAEGTTVFFSSHQIAEVERVADRVSIIDHGSLVAEFSLDEMRQDYRRITLGFSVAPQACQFDIHGIQQIHYDGRQIVVWAKQNCDAIIDRARSLEAISIDVAPVGLREVFLGTVREAR
jgi:ABC-2 type transport system ATP-binding protein